LQWLSVSSHPNLLHCLSPCDQTDDQTVLTYTTISGIPSSPM
jgi:hypothetical protein